MAARGAGSPMCRGTISTSLRTGRPDPSTRSGRSAPPGAEGRPGWRRIATHEEDDMAKSPSKPFEVTKTDAEWRSQLTPEQYNVLRDHGTERAGTSPLNKEYGAGT